MKKATDALLSDHKMIRKLLENFHADNPRYPEVIKTLYRVLLTHAWFEDNVFIPVFRNDGRIIKNYLDELNQEHKDLDYLMQLVLKGAPQDRIHRDPVRQQFRAVLETHLKKEEDALFPLAEKILGDAGQNKLGAEMEMRQAEAQKLFAGLKT
jgi:iron-sulfur cluster repair protein YtfE (RIC family)